MYSIVSTAIIHGIQSVPISVEADVSDGLPVFEMVGFLASEVQEAKERVRTALKNCGFALPPKHITINFTPANIRKSGSGFVFPVLERVSGKPHSSDTGSLMRRAEAWIGRKK